MAIHSFVIGVSRNAALVVGYDFISQPWGKYEDVTLTFWPASCVGIGMEVELPGQPGR